MGLFKKPWEKILCSFALQEYGVGNGKGWVSITQPTGTVISKEEAQEFFSPDKHYRVVARALEGDGAGRFVGVLWQHYEPHKGLVQKEGKEKTTKEPPAKVKSPEEVMEEYAEHLDRTLQPLARIGDILDKLRGRLAPAQEQGIPEGNVPAHLAVPPPEFDGKLPVYFHPFVVHNLAEEAKGLINYGATRLEKIFGTGAGPGQLPNGDRPEEAEGTLPTISSYLQKKAEGRTPTEVQPEEIPEAETIPPPASEETEGKEGEEESDTSQEGETSEAEDEGVLPAPRDYEEEEAEE